MKTILAVGLLCWFAAIEARAEITWRLSIKLIADEEGQIPASWVRRLQADVTHANRVLARSARGYRLEITELLTLTGVSQWHATKVDSANAADLHNAARAQPALYGLRTNAINVYVVYNRCGFYCHHADGAGEVLLTGAGDDSVPLLHLCGHYFNLEDTHLGQRFLYDNGGECGLLDPCGCARQLPGDGDGTDQTAPDNQCYPDSDTIARAAFNLPFAELDPGRQLRVENTRYNVMSYHDQADRLTADQLDIMTNDSNNRRRAVASGNTWFVATNGSDSNSGRNSNNRFKTATKALSVAVGGDVILLRGGTYTVPAFINQPLTISATRGEVDLFAQ